jgi:hypothetical protein
MSRTVGAKNKLPQQLKDMIEAALYKAGGRDYLVAQAEKNPAAFMALVGKLIPKDLNISGELHYKLEQLILGEVSQINEQRDSTSH